MIPLPECWATACPRTSSTRSAFPWSLDSKAPPRSPTPCAPAQLTPLDPHHFLCSLSFLSALQVSTSPAQPECAGL